MGTPVARICRTTGISQATYFVRTKNCAGPLLDETQPLKALEDECAQLKKIVADLNLGRETLQDINQRRL